MNGEIISIETANKLGKAKKLEIENIKLKSDNELYKHLYEIELKRNKELQEENEMLNNECDTYMKIATKKQERIDKAIEYIQDNSAFMNDDEWEVFNKKDLLNILQGEEE
jgi:hypothetical protein